MPDSPPSRSSRRSTAWLLGACFAGLATGADLARADPPPDPPPGAPPGPPAALRPALPPGSPPVVLIPSIGLQETYTDNALLSAGATRSDFVTRGTLGLEGRVESARTNASLAAEIAYDAYARNSALSGTTLDVRGGGSYALVKDVLNLEVSGVVSDGYRETLLASATERSGTPDRLRLATYQVGPHLTSRLGGLIDVDAAARFSQIFYSGEGRLPATDLPRDDNIVQFVGEADTGARHAAWELMTTGEFDGDVHGFRAGSGVESVFLRVLPRTRLFARGGYEHFEQPGVVNLDAPIWTGGLEYTPTAGSTFTIEGGRRYHRQTWAARAELQIASRYQLSGEYTEVIQPDQLYAIDVVSQFLNLAAQLPPPSAPNSAGFAVNLYNQVSLNKLARLVASYKGSTQDIDVSAHWSDREFLRSHDHDRTVSGDVVYQKRFGPTLTARADVNYTRTFQSPLFGATRTGGALAMLAYRLSRTVDVSGAFKASDARQLFAGGVRIRERAVILAIKKRF